MSGNSGDSAPEKSRIKQHGCVHSNSGQLQLKVKPSARSLFTKTRQPSTLQPTNNGLLSHSLALPHLGPASAASLSHQHRGSLRKVSIETPLLLVQNICNSQATGSREPWLQSWFGACPTLPSAGRRVMMHEEDASELSLSRLDVRPPGIVRNCSLAERKPPRKSKCGTTCQQHVLVAFFIGGRLVECSGQ